LLLDLYANQDGGRFSPLQKISVQWFFWSTTHTERAKSSTAAAALVELGQVGNFLLLV
jgi:hypothetical protein